MTEDELQGHVKTGTKSIYTLMQGWSKLRAAALPIMCADGFILSVQGGVFAYCSPRNNDGPYTHVEVGYPSAREPLLMPFAEDPDKPTSTVYGYVPVHLVLEVINNHGGMFK